MMHTWALAFIIVGILFLLLIRYFAPARSLIHNPYNRLNLMRALLDHSNSCIYVKDMNLKYLLVNKHALEVFGFKEHEVIGKTDDELFPAPFAISSRASDLRVLNEGQTIREEDVAYLRTGNRDFYTIKTPLKNEQEIIYAFCGIAVDITAQKMAQKQLNDYLEKLEDVTTELMDARIISDQVNRAQNAFLASMNHELRTPLNGIIGNLSLLLNTELSAPQEKYLNRIQHSSEVLMSIIEQVLDFSKISAGKVKLVPNVSNLEELAKECYQILVIKAEEKKLEFKLELPPNPIPPVLVDQIRFKEILINLTNNAIKFTSKGEVVLKLEAPVISTQKVLVQISIQDTGIGMSEEQLSHLFEKFWQGKPCQSGGTGLGLVITKELITLMNGEIIVASKEGEGTHITVKIPFSRDSA